MRGHILFEFMGRLSFRRCSQQGARAGAQAPGQKTMVHYAEQLLCNNLTNDVQCRALVLPTKRQRGYYFTSSCIDRLPSSSWSLLTDGRNLNTYRSTRTLRTKSCLKCFRADKALILALLYQVSVLHSCINLRWYVPGRPAAPVTPISC